MFKFSLMALLFVMAMLLSNQAGASSDPTGPFDDNISASVTLGDKRLALESIIHGDGIHTAVINGKVLRLFDYIDAYQLTAVNTHSVILRSKTKRLKLSIFKIDVVKVSTIK